MRALIFSSQADALALSSRLDSTLGLPRCECPMCSGSMPPPGSPAECCCTDVCAADCPYATLRWTVPLEHPTDGRWAYPVDAVSEPHLTAGESADVVDLPADWFPTAATP